MGYSSIAIERREGEKGMAIIVHDIANSFALFGISDLPYPDPTSTEFWELCIRLYEELGYKNNVNIKIKGMDGGPEKLVSRPRDDL
jgi:hypothetical protein